MEDDFGDLYADLDDRENVRIAAIQETCSGKELDSTSEEDGADERVGAGEMPMNCDVLGSEDSESEDDLHIVLNEEDRSRLPTSERGNGGLGMGWSEEEDDEDEDLVIVTGSHHHQNNDHKRVEQLSIVDGLVHGSAKRGSAAKIVCNGWCAGSQITGFPTRSVTSMPGKLDWDQFMIGSGVSTSCNSCILSEAKSGCSFSLPRKRTIFDINIEALEQKPWRQEGVDITDYFNFDLNEDSWKSYCRDLDQFRQQAKVSTQLSVNETSMLNQMPAKYSNANESAQCVYTERISSMDNLDNGLRRLEMRKGRAIQVEHGSGERIPSIDIRRPRYRDCDVVIQVTTKNLLEDCPIEESGYLDKQDRDFLGSKYESQLHESEFRPECDTQLCPAILTSSEVPRTNAYFKINGAEDPEGSNASILKAPSPYTTEDNNKSSSDSDNLSKASENTGSSKKNHSFARKGSMNSVSTLHESNKSDSDNSDGFGNNSKNLKEQDWECDRNGPSFSTEKYTDRNRIRLDNMVEVVPSAFCEEDSVPLTSQNGISAAGVGCRTEENHDYELDVWGHLSFKKKTKRPRSNKRSRHAEKYVSGKASTKVFYRKGKNDLEDHSQPKRVSSDNNRTNSEDFGLYEQYHGERERRDVCLDYHELDLKSNSFSFKKDPYLCRQKGKLDQHSKIKGGHDQKAVQQRCNEQNLFVMQKRHIACFSREEEAFNHKCDRYGNARKLRKSNRRDENETSSRMDLNRSNWYFENDAHFATPGQRSLHHATSPRDIFSLSLRSNEHYGDHKHSLAIRERRFLKKKYFNHFQSINYRCHSSYKNDAEFARNEYSMDERDLHYDENMEFIGLSESQHCADDEVWLRHQEQVGLSTDAGSFYFMKDARNVTSHMNRHVVGYSYSGDHVLINGKKITAEESVAPDSRADTRSVLENFDKQRRKLGTLEHREAVNLHVNGVKRKLLRRGIPDALVTKGQNNAENQEQKKANSSRSKKDVGHQHQEFRYPLSKLERKQQHPVSLDAVAYFERKKPGDHTLKKCQDRKIIAQDHEDDEIEEGQLIEESDYQVDRLTKDITPKENINCSVVKSCFPANLEEKNKKPRESTSKTNPRGYDNKRILETLAKMEKRRERFKEPIAPKQVETKNLNLQRDVAAVMDEVKQQRPARKRRWGASS